jgi:hypothetical protein
MATVALQGTIGVGLPGENMVLPARDITMDAAIAAIKGEEAQAIVELSEPHKFRNVSAELCKTFGFSEKETLCLGTRLLCGPLTSASDMRAAMAAAEMGENGTAIVALYSKNCTPLAIRLEVPTPADKTPKNRAARLAPPEHSQQPSLPQSMRREGSLRTWLRTGRSHRGGG